MAVRITCINKSGGYHENPHEAVSAYGWKNESNGNIGKNDRESMVKWMEEEGGEAYVKDSVGNIAYCFVNQNTNGTNFCKLIKTAFGQIIYLNYQNVYKEVRI